MSIRCKTLEPLDIAMNEFFDMIPEKIYPSNGFTLVFDSVIFSITIEKNKISIVKRINNDFYRIFRVTFSFDFDLNEDLKFFNFIPECFEQGENTLIVNDYQDLFWFIYEFSINLINSIIQMSILRELE